MMDYSTKYMGTCKEIFLRGIRPGNSDFMDTKEFDEFESIAKKLMENIGYEQFSYFMMEYQYSIATWTAYFLLRFSASIPDATVKSCLEELISYKPSNKSSPDVGKN